MRALGPRLKWRDHGSGVWMIHDSGDVRKSTGTADAVEAERLLGRYISLKHATSASGPETMPISAVLELYEQERGPEIAARERLGFALVPLSAFWGDLPASAVNGRTCRRYVASRGRSSSTARRELGVLQAALNHCHREGYMTSVPVVSLPSGGPSRERWLSRDEAAWLIRGALAAGPRGRHIADFIEHSIYTGSRLQTTLAMRINQPSFDGGHVDTVSGVFHRKPLGKRVTKKQQTPARLPPRYLAQVRRMAANGKRFIVENTNGDRLHNIYCGFNGARQRGTELAQRAGKDIDLTDVVPHVLKHTAVTWALQNGASKWDVAGYFGTSMKTIEATYGHHAPDHMQSAVIALDRRS